jgi:hypothetical protein
MESTTVDIVGTLLDISLPWLGSESRAILMALIAAHGVFRSADLFASAIGARSRHRVAYLLHRDGLPSLEPLAAWIRVVFWMVECDVTGWTLCRSSLEESRDPAYCYRLVKHLTGKTWSQVRQLGVVWLVEEFLQACRKPSVRSGDSGAIVG